MGHRCNYAKREHGKVELYYSHWGGLSVPRDFFWGLAAALEFLDEHEPTDEGWLDDVWGEGGAALDLDTKTLTIYGGEISGPARGLLFELANEIWSADGFTVRDTGSFVSVAAAVGVDPETIEAPHLATAPLDVADDKDTGRSNAMFGTLVVLDRTVRLARDNYGILELGAERVAELDRLPDLAEATRLCAAADDKRSLSDRVHEIVVLDTSARRLRTTSYLLRSGASRRHLAAKWPEWELVRATSNELRTALELPEFPPWPPKPEPPLAEVVAKVERFLFDERQGDLGAWFAELAAKNFQGGWINPHAVAPTIDGRPADATDANTRFRTAVARVLARRHG